MNQAHGKTVVSALYPSHQQTRQAYSCKEDSCYRFVFVKINTVARKFLTDS